MKKELENDKVITVLGFIVLLIIIALYILGFIYTVGE